MSTLFPTLIIAFIVLLVAIGALALSWLIKGKSILRPGACGRDPTKKRDEGPCGTDHSCSLCDKEEDSSKSELDR
jgi:hypothetical protein